MACVQLTSHKRIYILSCKHASRPIRVRVLSQLFYKMRSILAHLLLTTGFQKRINQFSKASQKDQVSFMLNLRYPFRLWKHNRLRFALYMFAKVNLVELMAFVLRMLLQRSLGGELPKAHMTSYFNRGHFAGCLFKMKAVMSHFRLLRKNELNIKVQRLAEMCDMMT